MTKNTNNFLFGLSCPISTKNSTKDLDWNIYHGGTGFLKLNCSLYSYQCYEQEKLCLHGPVSNWLTKPKSNKSISPYSKLAQLIIHTYFTYFSSSWGKIVCSKKSI